MGRLKTLLSRMLRFGYLFSRIKQFGLIFTVKHEFISLYKSDEYRHSLVVNYLKRSFASYLSSTEFANGETEAEPITGDLNIWVCWWQGVESMPPITKACYNSILRNAGNHKVQLVTKDNYKSFVTLPDNIIEKVESGIFSITQFSDILRFHLLSEHGGLWLDATLYITSPIEVTGKVLFSLKQDPRCSFFVSNYRWAAFCLGGGKNNQLFVSMKRLFLEYWQKHNILIDYFLVDYFISMMYDSSVNVKSMIDDIPNSNLQVNVLESIMNNTFDIELYRQITSDTSYHKLTWKQEFQEFDKDGNPTFYGYIINN